MTVHPARLVLADHQPRHVTPATQPAEPVRCDCDWTGPWCEFPEHQTDALLAVGMLRTDWMHTDAGPLDRVPPETPTARVLADRDANSQVWAKLGQRVGEIQAREGQA